MRRLTQILGYSLITWLLLGAHALFTAFLANTLQQLPYTPMMAGVALGLVLAFGVYIGAQFSAGEDTDA